MQDFFMLLKSMLWEDAQFFVAGAYFVDGANVSGCTHIRDRRVVLPDIHDLAGGGDHRFFQSAMHQVNFIGAVHDLFTYIRIHSFTCQAFDLREDLAVLIFGKTFFHTAITHVAKVFSHSK